MFIKNILVFGSGGHASVLIDIAFKEKKYKVDKVITIEKFTPKELKQKVKAFCDKNFKETASNFTGDSGVDMIVGSEYYATYGDVYGKTGYPDDDSLYTDYGQKWNGRQFFKHDFMPKFTNSLTNSSF